MKESGSGVEQYRVHHKRLFLSVFFAKIKSFLQAIRVIEIEIIRMWLEHAEVNNESIDRYPISIIQWQFNDILQVAKDFGIGNKEYSIDAVSPKESSFMPICYIRFLLESIKHKT